MKVLVLCLREKLEENLVNAMETIDSELENGQTEKKRSSLMFKIASKSKTQFLMILNIRERGILNHVLVKTFKNCFYL